MPSTTARTRSARRVSSDMFTKPPRIVPLATGRQRPAEPGEEHHAAGAGLRRVERGVELGEGVADSMVAERVVGVHDPLEHVLEHLARRGRSRRTRRSGRRTGPGIDRIWCSRSVRKSATASTSTLVVPIAEPAAPRRERAGCDRHRGRVVGRRVHDHAMRAARARRRRRVGAPPTASSTRTSGGSRDASTPASRTSSSS